MNGETFERVYFNDNYQQQFEHLRNRYHARTQQALHRRPVDTAPVPNVEEIIFLHDDGDNGVHITTGDFVEYFNQRFGGNDRIGAMRASLQSAARKAEMRRETQERRGVTADRTREKSHAFQPLRSVKPRFAFLHAVFALLLLLSVGILGSTSYLLEATRAEVLALEEEVAVLEATRGTVLVEEYNTVTAEAQELPAMDGESSVEIYAPQRDGGVEMAALLNALASLGK